MSFTTPKQKTPGRFTQDMLPALRGAISEDPRLKLLRVELGDNPVDEDVEVELAFATDENHTSTSSGGSGLSFTFTSEMSVEENLSEFREFVSDAAKNAGQMPETEAANS